MRKHRTYMGWGVIDTTDQVSSRAGFRCPFYVAWTGMIYRVRSAHKQEISPSYSGATICEEWKSFTAFREWMAGQPWEDTDLDKDILMPGNKHYSPSTCALVPRYLNIINTNCSRKPGAGLMTGVKHCANHHQTGRPYAKPYRATVSLSKHRIELGSFATEAEAHAAWQHGKAATIETAVSWYAKHPSFRTDVAEAMIGRAWRLRCEAASGVETIQL